VVNQRKTSIASPSFIRELANGLERLGYGLDRQKDGFRVAAIPRDVERAFSKRRQAIEEAARTHGYKTPKGMELATLRTRRAKQDMKLDGLLKTWQAEAKAMGFALSRDHQRSAAAASERSRVTPAGVKVRSPSPRTASAQVTTTAALQQTAAQIGQQLGNALRSLDQPSAMQGVRIKLRSKDREHERE
jgi:hypothetical protein